jgi:simple sugar transport system permease protein
MALLFIGGETAQLNLQLPAAITGLFQGMLLFFLLAADAFIENRYRFGRSKTMKKHTFPIVSTETA